jgi:hypothetical protein
LDAALERASFEATKGESHLGKLSGKRTEPFLILRRGLSFCAFSRCSLDFRTCNEKEKRIFIEYEFLG